MTAGPKRSAREVGCDFGCAFDEGEEVLWTGRNVGLGAAPKVLYIGLAASWFSFLLNDYRVILVACLFAAVEVLEARSRRYLLTTQRARVEVGILAKSSVEVRLEDVRSVAVSRTLVEQWCGLGDLVFSSSAGDGAEVIFSDLSKPNDVAAIARKVRKQA